jgi:quercetin dioxygenase-like cupin family protein
MQIGMIGLDRMGGNMARRLTKGGHQCIVFDRNRENVNTLAKEGPAPAYSLEELGLPHILENTSDELSPRTTKPRTRKNITMKRIRTLKPVGLPRFVYALIVCAPLVATLGVGSVMAADNNAKITLVYEHALPNVPGKSIKGVLVEYGPGGSSPAHTHPKSAFIYATVLEGAIRSSVNDGPVVIYRTGQSFSEMPGDRHSVSENASKTEPAKLLAVFVVDTAEKELTTPYEK